MNYDFKNKTILITGATRGIGKSIADCFLKYGANLILTGTKQKEISALNKVYFQNSKVNYFHLDFLDSKSKNFFIKIF